MKPLTSRAFGLALAAILALASSRCVAAALRKSQGITQYGINEVASVLEQARRTIVEDSRQYRKGEPLRQYIDRIAAALPGETAPHRRARMHRYLAALAKAVKACSAFRHVPPVTDRSASNLLVWRHTAQDCQDLPEWLQKLSDQWNHEMAHPGADRTRKQISSDFAHTVAVLSATLGCLRDARP